MAVEFSKLGGLAVLNLEGVQTRYDDPAPVLARDRRRVEVERHGADAEGVLRADPAEPDRRAHPRDQGAGGIAAVSATPMNTKKFAPIAADAGVDVFVVQSTVTSARHISRSEKGLIFDELVAEHGRHARGRRQHRDVRRDEGADGDGHRRRARRRRSRRGVHEPRSARHRRAAGHGDDRCRGRARHLLPRDRPLRADHHRRRHHATAARCARRSPPAPTRVMLGSILAATDEAPGAATTGAWRRRTASCRAARASKVGIDTTLQQTLFGPTRRARTGARTSSARCGRRWARAARARSATSRRPRWSIAPAIKTEGKSYQMEQR